MRKFIVFLACAASLAVVACNTVSGVGEDLEAAGTGVQGAAADAKN